MAATDRKVFEKNQVSCGLALFKYLCKALVFSKMIVLHENPKYLQKRQKPDFPCDARLLEVMSENATPSSCHNLGDPRSIFEKSFMTFPGLYSTMEKLFLLRRRIFFNLKSESKQRF